MGGINNNAPSGISRQDSIHDPVEINKEANKLVGHAIKHVASKGRPSRVDFALRDSSGSPSGGYEPVKTLAVSTTEAEGTTTNDSFKIVKKTDSLHAFLSGLKTSNPEAFREICSLNEFDPSSF